MLAPFFVAVAGAQSVSAQEVPEPIAVKNAASNGGMAKQASVIGSKAQQQVEAQQGNAQGEAEPSSPDVVEDSLQTHELSDLIPDHSVEDPQAWAAQGTLPENGQVIEKPGEVQNIAQNQNPVDTQTSAPATTQLDNIDEWLAVDDNVFDDTGIALEWPDTLRLPAVEPLESDATIEFAVDDTVDDALARDTGDRKIGSGLVLALPGDGVPFPEADAFVQRYEILSSVRGMDDDADNLAQLGARARADQALLEQLLRVYGYYDGQVLRTVGAGQPGSEETTQDATVKFDIIPGERYKVGAVDLGDLQKAPDYPALRSSFAIQAGDYLSSDKIVEEQANLGSSLGELGYAFAQIDTPDLQIDHKTATGDLTLFVRPNGKYAFAGVESAMPAFLSGRHLEKIARFQNGDTYSNSLQSDLRQAIVSTGLVSSVSVTARELSPPEDDKPGEVVLDVDMTPAKLRTISGAIGYGSEEGVRIEAAWEHRNLFPPEGSLRLRGIVGTQEQLAGVTFRKNNFGGRDKVLTVDTYASTIDSDAYDARTLALVGTYERTSTLLFQKPLSWSIGAELLATDERTSTNKGERRPREEYFIAALPVSALIDTSNDLLDPSRGVRLGARLSPEISRSQGNTDFYIRGQADANYYHSISDRVVAAGRLRFASIPGAGVNSIAPSRRLYAGGGGSVRGYGYQQIGPRDEFDEPNGGTSLVEVAAEVRIRTGFLDGAVSLVPFVDAGTVSRKTLPDFEIVRVGAGLGLRYDTGFGPIRVDLGFPINPGPGDNPVAIYVGLGQAF